MYHQKEGKSQEKMFIQKNNTQNNIISSNDNNPLSKNKTKSQIKYNSKILDKTQVAIQIINKYQAKKTIYANGFLNNNNEFQNNIYNPYNILNKISQINDQYLIYTHHRELQLDRKYKIQLMPYSQEYYVLPLKDVFFPLRILLKNVRSQFVIYIGYDKQYPGSQTGKDPAIEQLTKLQKQKQLSKQKMKKTMNKFSKSKKKLKSQQQSQKEKKTFDEHFVIDKDILITLKKKSQQPAQKMYLAFVAKEALAMFTLKLQSIGYIQKSQNKIMRTRTEGNLESYLKDFSQNQLHKRVRLNSQINPDIFSKFKLPDPFKRVKTVHQQQDQANQYFIKKSNTELNLKFKNLNSMADLRRTMNLNKNAPNYKGSNMSLQQSPQKKRTNFIKANTKDIKKHTRSNSKQVLEQKKIDFKKKLQTIKQNKQSYDKLMEKQKQLREVANKFKKMIGQYQQSYMTQKLQSKKLNPKLCAVFYAALFLKQANLYHKVRQTHLKMFYKVNFLVKKFKKKLKKQCTQNIILVSNKQKRTLMQTFEIIQFHSRIINPNAQAKATCAIHQVFNQLKPGLLINHLLQRTNKYRRSIRLIQRSWLNKFKARTVMLQYFGHMHVKQMLIEFPHFKFVQSQYQYNKVCKQICYQYMTDQSLKFRNIYAAYLYQLKEINQYIQKNKEIKKFNEKNKDNLKIKQKQYFILPKKPARPQQRIFRNLNILKSMLRGWFQLKFKAWKKKQTG